MIDQAIGNVEGAGSFIDFNLLQTVLHCIAQQLRIEDKKVDMRGASPNFFPITSDTATVEIHEFVQKGVTLQEVNIAVKRTPPSQETILVVEKRTKGQFAETTAKDEDARVAGSFGPSVLKLSRTKSLENLNSRDEAEISNNCETLRQEINKLNENFYKTMNHSGIKAQNPAGSTMSDGIPILPHTQNKIDSLLLPEIAEHVTGLRKDLNNLNEAMYETLKNFGAAAMTSSDLPGFKGILPELSHANLSDMSNDDVEAVLDNIKGLHSDLETLNEAFYRTMQMVGVPVAPDFITPAITPGGKVKGLTADGNRLTTPSKALVLAGARSGFASSMSYGGGVQDLIDIEDKVNKLEELINFILTKLGIDVADKDDIIKAMKQKSTTTSKSSSKYPAIGGGIQTEQDATAAIAAEKQERTQCINALLTKLNVMAQVKIDRADVKQQMAEKADLKELATKVPLDLFEMTCNDIWTKLNALFDTLNMQEGLWQQALDDVQRELETKYDKLEIVPVKNDFNAKLDKLKESIRQLYKQHKDPIGFATAKKLLSGVNCITCNSPTTMKMTAKPCVPGNDPLPITPTMKPYLSLELDDMRKAILARERKRSKEDSDHPGRHMTQKHLEDSPRSNEDTRHACVRYCGGSHTTTTAAQRVGRHGNFKKQWGVEAIPLSSGLATGDDGKMYRVANVESENVGPGGKIDEACKPMRISDAKPPTKPIIISNECRCIPYEENK